MFGFFFFKQKTAYEMRISDWSSDVCSSDLCTTRTTSCLPCPGRREGDESKHEVRRVDVDGSGPMPGRGDGDDGCRRQRRGDRAQGQDRKSTRMNSSH